MKAFFKENSFTHTEKSTIYLFIGVFIPVIFFPKSYIPPVFSRIEGEREGLFGYDFAAQFCFMIIIGLLEKQAENYF
ncbi:MAG: hypothetical protein DYG83_09345 [Candidatus Brocadia sp. AMX2]|nr:MAG: hypothetical protein EDM70_08150 [Candidatus Brocadia sp. AMX2]MBC6932571.1 hypothetical protein [Candidatus Brocadia sp.]MBL1168105.1 hypothetical protein [Candidatus Brocadia sp. AMX1]MCE7867017.1 hypothetical protein [Candidatus Brocadia sp. AMX2]MCQ3917610.1 hypothetical protein [Candidatus Brocadia sp.]